MDQLKDTQIMELNDTITQLQQKILTIEENHRYHVLLLLIAFWAPQLFLFFIS